MIGSLNPNEWNFCAVIIDARVNTLLANRLSTIVLFFPCNELRKTTLETISLYVLTKKGHIEARSLLVMPVCLRKFVLTKVDGKGKVYFKILVSWGKQCWFFYILAAVYAIISLRSSFSDLNFSAFALEVDTMPMGRLKFFFSPRNVRVERRAAGILGAESHENGRCATSNVELFLTGHSWTMAWLL